MDKVDTIKDLAIEFAKHLMQTKVSKARYGSIEKTEVDSYVPNEYKLMHGNLIKHGVEMFDEFYEKHCNDYYAE